MAGANRLKSLMFLLYASCVLLNSAYMFRSALPAATSALNNSIYFSVTASCLGFSNFAITLAIGSWVSGVQPPSFACLPVASPAIPVSLVSAVQLTLFLSLIRQGLHRTDID